MGNPIVYDMNRTDKKVCPYGQVTDLQFFQLES